MRRCSFDFRYSNHIIYLLYLHPLKTYLAYKLLLHILHYSMCCWIYMIIRHQSPLTTSVYIKLYGDSIHKTYKNGVINIPIEIDDQSNKFWHLNWTRQKIFYTPQSIIILIINLVCFFLCCLLLLFFHLFTSSIFYRMAMPSEFFFSWIVC